VELAKFYYKQGADELVLLDITATLESRQTMLELVEKVGEQIFIPFTVGGGIKSLKDIEQTLRAGADKVAINTAAVKDPQLIRQAARKFGSQCVVVAVDALKAKSAKLKVQSYSLKLKADTASKQSWVVVINAGTKRTGLDIIEWLKKVERLGAGEILLTSIDRDGTRSGYDLELLQRASEAINIPVIASGGAGSKKDVLQALTVDRADAALIASLFHYGEIGVLELKKYLRKKKVRVRI
jgi:cyclase